MSSYKKFVRAIVIKDGQLLVINRNKFGEEYITLPGGKIEEGETPEQALHREMAEETTIKINDPRLVIVEKGGDKWGAQMVFLCEYVSGEPALAPDSVEAHLNREGKNLYYPRWLPLELLPESHFRSEGLKREVLKALQTGWPHAAVEITTA
jgi:ADP-ribose pyrophosphatase YjhB (NUDIX family)